MHYFIFEHIIDLPEQWDRQVAYRNVFLSRAYLYALEKGLPENMGLRMIAIFYNQELRAGAILQTLDFHKHHTLNSKTSACSVKNAMIRRYASKIQFLGNNMLSGEHAFDGRGMEKKQIAAYLQTIIPHVEKKYKTQLTIVKDFFDYEILTDWKHNLSHYHQFEVQPTMHLPLAQHWCTIEDYCQEMAKKYRKRIHTAQNKLKGVETRDLDLKDLSQLQDSIHQLYYNVAENASFNTFFLSKNHFYELKINLQEKFKIIGFFEQGQLLSFCTLIHNHKTLETYFLGYNKELQKEKQLYLNMLIKMVEYGIEYRFENINFGRTALEIKSTIGAEPRKLYGLIKHNNFVINHLIPYGFERINPYQPWEQRHPFRAELPEIQQVDKSF